MTTTAPAWHALSSDEALRRLASTAEGLSEDEARARLERSGPNALTPPRAEPAWRILLRQFRSIVVALLLGAGVIAMALGDAADAAAIAAVLALNVALGFVTELRARRAMHALRRLDIPFATVLRGGNVRDCAAADLVPGDVIVLEAGRAVPADARLIASAELRANEAALTGESLPSDKRAAATLGEQATLAERTTVVFKATDIVAGSGRAVVVATGMRTEVGRIGTLLGAVREEPTPVERHLDALGRRLAAVAVVAGSAVGAIAWLRGMPLGVVLQTAIAVAVAAVPEGLPAVVTIAMAVGVHRMARRHALVRRLSVVETLGAATVICTDKTGTLTAGEQTVVALWVAGRSVSVTGAGYEEHGAFYDAAADRESGSVAGHDAAQTGTRHRLEVRDHTALTLALEASVLANRGDLSQRGTEWQPRGDPTDVAFVVAARKAGIDRVALRRDRPEIGELPFSSRRMLMATFHRMPDGETRAYVKGAVRRVLERCDAILVDAAASPLENADATPLGDEARAAVIAAASELGASGLRVIAIATGPVDRPTDDALHGLTFVALAGLTDPPAHGVPETVQRLQHAGIRLVMITGDQHETAAAIGRTLGILSDGGLVLGGDDVDRMRDDELDAAVPTLAVVSRATPEGKLRLVEALARAGEVVAMLGDGINDAAALKRAHIGVAMGRRGTDVAKDASGIILQDDRFDTIAAAVEEGRVVFTNIRRFVFYLFSCNVAELVALLVAGLASMPLPATPLQILWLNLVTDGVAALPLVFEPAERHVLRRPPRHPAEPILPARMMRAGAGYAVLIAAVTLAALAWGLRATGDPASAVTMSFTTLALAQLFHLGNVRSDGAVLTPQTMFSNPWAVAAVAFVFAVQVAAVQFAPLARVLGTVPLPVSEWLVVLGLSIVPAVVGQGAKLLGSRRRAA